MIRVFQKFMVAAAFILVGNAAFSQSIGFQSPVAGSLQPSSVYVVATANGGAYPVTATRLYVDNVIMYTAASPNLVTNVTLAPGGHDLVVVGWNTAGASFTASEQVTVAGGAPAPTVASVTITSPAATNIGTSLRFVATATPASGRSISAMAVYLDNQSVYKGAGASVNTTVKTTAGLHYAVVQSWDNTGAVTKSSINVIVSAPAPKPVPSPLPAPVPTGDLHPASIYISTQFSPTGALLYSAQQINPYYANLGAQGALRDPARHTQVEGWMRWYVSHLNLTDKWGVGGTMYDYNIVNGQEVSTGNADSTDSYAATFLSLAYAYYATGDPTAQAYVRSIAGSLDLIGQVLAKTQQSDGLTWAKPDYQIKYLMDNSEVFRGLADAATLFGSMGDTAKQQYYGALATKCQAGVWNMWLGNTWAVYKDNAGNLAAPKLTTWYPDASAQVFPVLYGVVSGSDPKAVQAYASFNGAWPGWPSLSFNSQDAFPWAMIAGASAQMGDTARTNAYLAAVKQKYQNLGFPWTWYSMENGWYMRTLAYMQGVRPY